MLNIKEWDWPKPKIYPIQERPHFQYYQKKLDGIRILLYKSEDVVAMTRSDSDLWGKIKDVPCVEQLVDILPEESLLDCELYGVNPDETRIPASSVKTLINEKSDLLRLTPFAMPFINGEDLRLFELGQVVDVAMNYNIPFEKFYINNNSDPEELLTMADQEGIEGYILKNGHYSHWWKLKPEKTVDVIITGILEGKGRNSGRMGALYIGVFDENGSMRSLGRVGTGFTDKEREEYFHDYTIGKIAEISYEGLASQGMLRFPRFVRMRDDKKKEECRIDQIQ